MDALLKKRDELATEMFFISSFLRLIEACQQESKLKVNIINSHCAQIVDPRLWWTVSLTETAIVVVSNNTKAQNSLVRTSVLSEKHFSPQQSNAELILLLYL